MSRITLTFAEHQELGDVERSDLSRVDKMRKRNELMNSYYNRRGLKVKTNLQKKRKRVVVSNKTNEVYFYEVELKNNHLLVSSSNPERYKKIKKQRELVNQKVFIAPEVR